MIDTSPIKIAIVDDKPELIRSLALNLALYEEIEIIATANNGAEALSMLKNNPDIQVILMDIEMPIMNGIEATGAIYNQTDGKVKIVILTVFDQDDKIFDAIKAGASGYLMKDERPNIIVNAINDVLQGGAPMSSNIAIKILDLLRVKTSTPKIEVDKQPTRMFLELTKREEEILVLIAQGLSYKNIAEQLFVSDKTIKKHIENIYSKLHINSKYQAIQLVQNQRQNF
jgi:DNA-binding NarL/FixJ family response regulator